MVSVTVPLPSFSTVTSVVTSGRSCVSLCPKGRCVDNRCVKRGKMKVEIGSSVLELVRFVLFSESDLAAYEEALRELQ